MHSPEVERARQLLNNMTKVERFVWSRLRSRQLGGFKFRRQVPMGPYFADFMCKAARFVVEIDGAGHGSDRDDRKTAWLETAGYRVFRVGAHEVNESIDDVMDSIFATLTSATPSPLPGRYAARPPHTVGR